VHGFRCYGNIAPNAKFQRVLVLDLRLVVVVAVVRTFYPLLISRAALSFCTLLHS